MRAAVLVEYHLAFRDILRGGDRGACTAAKSSFIRAPLAMPRFRVLIEGSGLEIPGEFAGVPSQTIRGFFVARVVSAPHRGEAGDRVLAIIADDWRKGGYASLHVQPTLRVAEVRPATLLEWLRPRRTGYAFHPG